MHYAIEFTERSIKRWINDTVLGCQPMMDQMYSYRGQDFESQGGYWVFNGRQFALLQDVGDAIRRYSDEIDRLTKSVADS